MFYVKTMFFLRQLLVIKMYKIQFFLVEMIWSFSSWEKAKSKCLFIVFMD